MSPPTLLTLPAELRLGIYSYVLSLPETYNPWHNLLLTCHQTNNEVVPLLCKEATLTVTLSRRSQIRAKLDYDITSAHTPISTLARENLAVIDRFARYCESFQNVVVKIEVDAHGKEDYCSYLECAAGSCYGFGFRLVHCWRIRMHKQVMRQGYCGAWYPFGWREAVLDRENSLIAFDTESDLGMANLMAKTLELGLPNGVWSRERFTLHEFTLHVDWVFIQNETDHEADGPVDNYEPDLWNREPEECFALFARALSYRSKMHRCAGCIVASMMLCINKDGMSV